jgi:dUTP pyrophosphatase
MQIKIQRIDKNLDLPRYSKEGDGAMDLRASHDEVIISSQKRLISTGIKMSIPTGHVGLIWDRSSIANDHSLHTLAGVIDSGYRGEVRVLMHNLGSNDVEIKKGMRIAQMLIQPVLNATLVEVDSLDETTRGEGGFGSTGIA